jgi:hypothetical protein
VGSCEHGDEPSCSGATKFALPLTVMQISLCALFSQLPSSASPLINYTLRDLVPFVTLYHYVSRNAFTKGKENSDLVQELPGQINNSYLCSPYQNCPYVACQATSNWDNLGLTSAEVTKKMCVKFVCAWYRWLSVLGSVSPMTNFPVRLFLF